MNELDDYRQELAQCDDEIINALMKRNMIVESIMSIKEKQGLPVLQPQQEEKQRLQLLKKLQGNKYQEEIEDVFCRIHRNSKRIQARKLFSYNLILIGFMGAGKTTISEYLNTLFAMNVVEMDQVITNRETMSIPDIFETYGEEYFRELETQLLIEMQSHHNTVVSCGGGAALREKNVTEMKKNGKVILLTAHPETILKRVKNSKERPILNGNMNVEFIADLMEKRRVKYEEAADIVIHTDDKTILETCEELIQKLSELEGTLC